MRPRGDLAQRRVRGKGTRPVRSRGALRGKRRGPPRSGGGLLLLGWPILRHHHRVVALIGLKRQLLKAGKESWFFIDSLTH